MDEITALYRELDPLRPLRGDEDALYVDWQHQLDPGVRDAKSRLVQTFRRNASPERPITRLLTGQRGCGKTTELNRVRRELDAGAHGSRVFVSMLFADEWLDREDVQPEDVALQIVRQLAADLRGVGMDLGEQRLKGFLGSLGDRLKGVRLDAIALGADPLAFSFKLEHFPTSRDEFRAILREQLPTVYDLVNRELLPAARTHLQARGYDDILLIVDDLDKIRRRVLGDGAATNLENIFLDGAPVLRAIRCSLLMTIPIELAYSTAKLRLRDHYAGSIHTVPQLPIVSRDGTPIAAGEDALIEIVGRRARRAFGAPDADPAVCAARIFGDTALLRRAVALSGGHLRGLLVMLSELLDWVDELPIGADTLERYAADTARELAGALHEPEREILRAVMEDRRASEDPGFLVLLRDHYIFAYRGEPEDWYGVNPLLTRVLR